MDAGPLVRARWRLSGALRWPMFVAATIADAAIGNALPPAGQTESVIGAALGGLVLNLLAVLLLSRPLGALIRRLRQTLPGVIARDYAATYLVLSVSGALLAAGLVHQGSVQANDQAMQEASARAEAWIGDRAPERFRREVSQLSLLEIQSGSLYRACVPSAPGTGAPHTFCVVVDVHRPWARSVRFAGSEPNSVFGEGVG